MFRALAVSLLLVGAGSVAGTVSAAPVQSDHATVNSDRDTVNCTSYEYWVRTSPIAQSLYRHAPPTVAHQWGPILYRLWCHVAQSKQPTREKSFNVTAASAENVTIGETTVVSARVTNPNSKRTTQPVTLRTGFEGEVVDRKLVEIPANGSATVNFTVRVTSDLFGGQPIAGNWTFFVVETRQHGEPAWFPVANETNETAGAVGLGASALAPAPVEVALRDGFRTASSQ